MKVPQPGPPLWFQLVRVVGLIQYSMVAFVYLVPNTPGMVNPPWSNLTPELMADAVTGVCTDTFDDSLSSA